MTGRPVLFTVHGTPAPAGSKRAIRRFRWRIWIHIGGRWRGIP